MSQHESRPAGFIIDNSSSINLKFSNLEELIKSCLQDGNSVLNATIANILDKINKYRSALEDEQIEGNLFTQENENSEIMMLVQEKAASDLKIQSLNIDLEQQIDECIELNDKLVQSCDSEIETRTALLSLLREMSHTNIYDEMSLPQLLLSLKHLVLYRGDQKSTNDVVQNDSIINLDIVPIDNLCLSSDGVDNRINIVKDCDKLASPDMDLLDNSCYNLDVLDSELLIDNSKTDEHMVEELEQLDFDDRTKTELLIKKSISIFMKSVLGKLDFGKNSKMEIQLTKVFAEYGNVMSRKLKNISEAYFDLNSTCVFERLEQELQAHGDVGEITKQLNAVSADNSSLLGQIEEISRAKEDSDSRVVSLQLEISNLASELQSVTANMQLICNQSKEADEIKYKLENSLKEGLEAKEANESHIASLITKLSDLTTELELSTDKVKQWQRRAEELELSNGLLADSTASLSEDIRVKNLAIEEEEQKNQVLKAHLDLSDLNIKLSAKMATDLQNDLNSRTLDLEATIDELIRTNEELDESKITLTQKEEQFVRVRNDLEELGKEKVFFVEEIVNLKKDLCDIEKKISEQNDIIGMLRSQLEEQLSTYSIKYDEMERSLKTSEDDNEKLVIRCSIMTEEIKNLSEELEENNRKNTSIEEQLDCQKMEAESIRKENNILKENFDNQVSVFENKYSELNNIVKERENQLEDLQSENDSLRELILTNDCIQLDLKNMEEQLIEMDNMLISVQQERDDAKEYAAEQETMHSDLVEQHKNLSQLLEEMRLKNRSDDEKMKDIQTEVEFLREELKTMTDKFIEIENLLVSVQEERMTLAMELETIRSNDERMEEIQKEMELLREDNDKMKKSVNDGLDSSDVNNLIGDQQEQLEILLKENALLRETNSSNYEWKNEMTSLELRYADSESKLASVEEERDNIMNYIGELEISLKKMESTIRHLSEEDKKNESSSELLKHLQMEIKEMERVKLADEEIKAEIENIKIELELKESIIYQLSNQLQSRSDELTHMEEESALFHGYKNQVDENMKALELMNKEVESYKRSIESLEKLRIRDGEEWQYERHLKDAENEDLRKKVMESLLAQSEEKTRYTYLFGQFESYKEAHMMARSTDENKENSKEEDKTKLQINTAEYNLLINAYNDLKNRYREKRKRTEDLEKKCREQGVVIDKSVSK